MVERSIISNTDVDAAVQTINPLFIHIINAVIIVIIGFVIGKIVKRILLKVFDMVEFDKITRPIIHVKGLGRMIAGAAGFLIYVIALVIAMNKLSLTTTIITTIVIVLIIVALLFVVFGVNDIFANLFAGMILRMKKNIRIGDHIKIKDQKISVNGTVEQITLLHVKLDTDREETVILPNTLLTRSVITKSRKAK